MVGLRLRQIAETGGCVCLSEQEAARLSVQCLTGARGAIIQVGERARIAWIRALFSSSGDRI